MFVDEQRGDASRLRGQGSHMDGVELEIEAAVFPRASRLEGSVGYARLPVRRSRPQADPNFILNNSLPQLTQA